jgi:hypothetical protein
MVRAGYHWSDRTTLGHLQSYISSRIEYEPTCDTYKINTLEGMMQLLFDRCHQSASRGNEDYTFTFLSSKLAGKEYTIEKIVDLCEECFIDCEIGLYAKYNICDELIGYSICIDWNDRLTVHEKAWNRYKRLESYYTKRDRH